MSLDPKALEYAAKTLSISLPQTLATLTLLVTEECTVPFITRYRKEKTGGLDEVQIRAIGDAYEEYIEREKRRVYILETLEKMEVLTPELKNQIMKADSLNVLEDIYAPYKQKKKTKGMLAREAGLLPLAELILSTPLTLDKILLEHTAQYLNPEKKIATAKDALEGAQDIIMEMMAHDVEIKEKLRQDYWKGANLTSSMKKDAEAIKDASKYKDYFEFSQNVSELKNPKHTHRFLAMRRGMTQKVLKVDVTYDELQALAVLKQKYFNDSKLGCLELIEQLAKKALQLSIQPSLDLEIKTELKKLSDDSAIDVFGINLKNLLLQPYLGPKSVLGIDPGVRTGLKLAVVDNTGKFIVDTVIYPHPPQNDKATSKKVLEAILDQFKVEHIAIGNGTYGRESLDFIQTEVRQVRDGAVKATMISEAGASIYSASDIARKEFPDKDPTVRGAISIARRFQDPLAELVKIDPKSIGVGQYQHDVNQAKLKKSLTAIVESCVNFVGVDLNTASAPLLSYISGIGPSVAENVVKFREEKGGFKSREDLLKVTRFSQKVYQQSAGFLRIYQGKNPLDGTFIHPETYPLIEAWAKKHNTDLKNLVSDKEAIAKLERDQEFKDQVGAFTFADLVKSLKAPTQDPRTEFKSFDFRKDIQKLEDLKINEWYPGVVTNITQFGAFVDIGLKENGLLHVSQIADKFVENALDELSVGQEVKVRVIEVDLERKRISLSCKQDASETARVNVSRGQQNTSGGNNRNNQNRAPNPSQDKPLKNNAFAALKNFKVK